MQNFRLMQRTRTELANIYTEVAVVFGAYLIRHPRFELRGSAVTLARMGL